MEIVGELAMADTKSSHLQQNTFQPTMTIRPQGGLEAFLSTCKIVVKIFKRKRKTQKRSSFNDLKIWPFKGL
jgi:hypothetical protein